MTVDPKKCRNTKNLYSPSIRCVKCNHYILLTIHKYTNQSCLLRFVTLTYSVFSQAMKEAMTFKRPALADEFIVDLMSGMQLDERTNQYTITKDKLNEVLQTMAISVMRVQRESYEK